MEMIIYCNYSFNGKEFIGVPYKQVPKGALITRRIMETENMSTVIESVNPKTFIKC